MNENAKTVPPNDDDFFRSHAEQDPFDDSINPTHQRELRERFLDAFDDAGSGEFRDIAGAELESRASSRRERFGVLVLVAAVLFIAVSTALRRHDDLMLEIVDERPGSPEADVSELVTSLAALRAVKSHDSRETLDYAISVCENDFQSRRLFGSEL